MSVIAQGFPSQTEPFVDARGALTTSGYRLLVSFYNRTGGAQGVNATVIYTTADSAAGAAAAAQASANAAQLTANNAQATASAAAADALFFGAEEGRLNAALAALSALPDPGLTALLLSGGR